MSAWHGEMQELVGLTLDDGCATRSGDGAVIHHGLPIHAAITNREAISLQRDIAYRHGLANVEIRETLGACLMPPTQHDCGRRDRTKNHKRKNEQLAPNPEAEQSGEEGSGC